MSEDCVCNVYCFECGKLIRVSSWSACKDTVSFDFCDKCKEKYKEEKQKDERV